MIKLNQDKKISLNPKKSMSDVLTDVATSSVKALPLVDNILALQDKFQGTQNRLPGAAEGQAMANRGVIAALAPYYTGIDTAIDVGGALATGGSPFKATVGLEPHSLNEFLPQQVKDVRLPNVLAGGVPQMATDALQGTPFRSDYTVGGVAPIVEEVGKIALSGQINKTVAMKRVKEYEKLLNSARLSIMKKQGLPPDEAEALAHGTIGRFFEARKPPVQKVIKPGKSEFGVPNASVKEIRKLREIIEKGGDIRVAGSGQGKLPKIKLGGQNVQDIKPVGEVAKGQKIVLSKDQPLRNQLGKAGFAYVGEGAEGFKDAPGKFSSLVDKKQRVEISDEGAQVNDNFWEVAKNKEYDRDIKRNALLKKHPGKTLHDLSWKGNQEAIDLTPSKPLEDSTFTLGEVLKHEELFKAYPKLKDVNVEFFDMGNDSQGFYDEKRNTIRIASKSAETKDTLLHEIQHAIQRKEGFAMGGSSTEFSEKKSMALARINSLNNVLSETAKKLDIPDLSEKMRSFYRKQYDDAMAEKLKIPVNIVQGDPYDNYRKLAGEVEARDVSARKDLTAEQRAKQPPLASQKIKLSDMIVKGTGGVSKSEAPSLKVNPKPTPEQEASYKDIVEKAGGKYRFVWDGYETPKGLKKESLVNFDEPGGSTLAIKVSELTPESVAKKLSDFAAGGQPKPQEVSAKPAESLESEAKKLPEDLEKSFKDGHYPMASRGEWYGESNYANEGGSLIEMTPDEFLEKAKRLPIDDEVIENVNDLKEHIKSGKTLDPLTLYDSDKTNVRSSDGRHRAIAAKELGIKKVPVVTYIPQPKPQEVSAKPPESLESEAKKYKSAEEFVASQKKEYDVLFRESTIETDKRLEYMDNKRSIGQIQRAATDKFMKAVELYKKEFGEMSDAEASRGLSKRPQQLTDIYNKAKGKGGLPGKLKDKGGFARIGKGDTDFQNKYTPAEKRAMDEIVKQYQSAKTSGKELNEGKYAKLQDMPIKEQIALLRDSLGEGDFVSDFVKARKIGITSDRFLEEEINRIPQRYRVKKGGYKADDVLQMLRDRGYEFNDTYELSDYLMNHIRSVGKMRSQIKKLQVQYRKQRAKEKAVKKVVKPLEKLGKPTRLKKAIVENVGAVKMSELSNLERSLQRQAQASREGVEFGKEEIRKQNKLKAANEEYKKLLKSIKSIKTDKMSRVPKSQIEEIQNMVDLSVPSKKTMYSLQSTLQALEANPEMELPDYVLDRVKRLDKLNKSNMTIDDLRAMHDAVKHYAKLEGLKNRLRAKGEVRRQTQVVQESIKQMKPAKEIIGDVIDVSKMKPTRDIKKTIGNLFGLSQDHYDLVTESLAGEDSVMHDVLFKQVKEGIRSALELKHELKEGLMKDVQALDLPKNWIDKNVKIGRLTFSNNQLVSIYLHSQNPDNLRHLQSGFATPKDQYKVIKFKDGELDKILEKIPDEVKEVAKIHWKYGDKIYDKLQKVFYEKNGYELPKVDKHYAIKVARGALPTDIKMDDALTELKGRFIRIGIQKGSTMKRVKSKLPLVLEGYFDAMAQHIDWASTYYGLEKPISNASKLLYDRKFKANLVGRYGMDVWKNIEKGLRDIAGAHEDMTDFGKVAMAAKNKLTKVVYGANIGVFVKQTLSFPLFNVYVPAKYLMQGVVEYNMNANAIEKNHMLMSPEFNERVKYGFNRDLTDVGSGKAGKALTTTKKPLSDKLMGGLKFFDRKTVSAGMQGAILQKLDELKTSNMTAGEKLKEAYRYADYVVNRTQPTFAKEHRSAMSRGNAMERMVTFATTATNMQRNLIVRTYRQWKRSGKAEDFLKFSKALFYSMVIIPIGVLVMDTMSDFLYRRVKPRLPTAKQAIGSIVGSWASNVYILRNLVTYAKSSLERGGYGGYGMDDALTRYMKNLVDTAVTSILAIGNPKKRLKAIDGILEQVLFQYELPYSTMKKLGTRAVQLGGWALENFEEKKSKSGKLKLKGGKIKLKRKGKLKLKRKVA